MSVWIENLCFSYGNRPVLHDISFSAEPGDFLSVLGPNGVGKSTLFRCLLGLLKPSHGSVFVDGTDIAGLSAVELAHHIAYIPQSHNPVFNFSVFDMVLMGTTAQMGQFSSPGRTQTELAEAALESLGIAHLSCRGYASISGGERQLVLIARGIAQQARVLIMDEPSANLDFGNRIRLMQVLQDLASQNYCVIQSTHDPEQAYQYSSRLLALHEGRILAWGSPQETFSPELVSTLYGMEVEVCSMRNDKIRVCIPVTRSFV